MKILASCLLAIIVLIVIAVNAVPIWIAIHFISKYW